MTDVICCNVRIYPAGTNMQSREAELGAAFAAAPETIQVYMNANKLGLLATMVKSTTTSIPINVSSNDISTGMAEIYDIKVEMNIDGSSGTLNVDIIARWQQN